MDKKSGVVAFAFGAPSLIASNIHIIFIAIDKAGTLEAPIYTQRDIFVPLNFEHGIEFVKEEEKNPPSTLRIARGAIAWAKKLDLSELWIAAAKPHLWRCLRDLKAAVYEAGVEIVIRYCKKIDLVPDYVWFCQNSVQARTRSAKAWERRERILRILPFFIYRIFCS